MPQGWKCPGEFIGKMKAGKSLWMYGHTTWCPEKGAACTHYIQHSTTWSSWAHWEMLGRSWLCASLLVRRSHRWGLLSEDRTCSEENVLVSSLFLKCRWRKTGKWLYLLCEQIASSVFELNSTSCLAGLSCERYGKGVQYTRLWLVLPVTKSREIWCLLELVMHSSYHA